jgi:Glycosyl hydrolase family 79 C-terminal beta domain
MYLRDMPPPRPPRPDNAAPLRREGRARRTAPPFRRIAVLVAALGVVALAATALLVSPGPAPRQVPRPVVSRPVTRPPRVQAEVTVLPDAGRLPISSSYLGFSTEYWGLPVDSLHVSLFHRILGLVHVPGSGPLSLRIGGDSSDHAFWDPALRGTPTWAFRLSPDWISDTAQIVRQNHLRVIIDLNFITGTPSMAADWAAAAERQFPRHSIVGFEVGNEPDLYDRDLWTAGTGGTGFALGALPQAITARDYALRYLAYARALARVAPHVPLYGPALALPNVDRRWISTLLAGPHPHLSGITVHEYPYSACEPAGSAAYPTVAKLLSPRAVAQMGAAVAPSVRLARTAGLPLRLTEFNSVTCGGVTGVSNTFATALWAPDALFTLARAGAASADLHVRAFSVNSPFRFHRHGVFARPLLYGLILFTRMLGRDSHLVRVRLRGLAGADVSAWAVTHGTRSASVLLLNKGRRSLSVRVRLPHPSGGAATMQRLLAPSARSTGHVTLAGQHLNRHARWVGRRVVESVPAVGGGYMIALRHTSAALVSFPLTARHRAAGHGG